MKLKSLKPTGNDRGRISFVLISVLLGFVFAFILLEGLLRLGGVLYPAQTGKEGIVAGKPLLLFSGDSWTEGADAARGESFFELIRRDPDFSGYWCVNLGISSSSPFEITNRLLEFKSVPDAAVVLLGINGWHTTGFRKFAVLARCELPRGAYEAFLRDFHMKDRFYFLKQLKVYRLFSILRTNVMARLNGRYFAEDFSLQDMDDKLSSDYFWEKSNELNQRYPDYEDLTAAVTEFLRKDEKLNLDEKFFFAFRVLAYRIKVAEGALKEAGIFHPEKLRVFPYAVYLEYGAPPDAPGNREAVFVKWAVRVLDAWAEKRSVKLIFQTYPYTDGRRWYAFINEAILRYAHESGREVVDHNAGGRDWKDVATRFHVTGAGHKRMYESLRRELVGLPDKSS